MELTQSYLKELFDYHPDGYLVWKSNRWTNKTKGKKAGTLFKNKKTNICYTRVTIDNKNYLLHRLIWIYHHGFFSKETIDHIDGNTFNNKISNLRQASKSENNKNRKITDKNKSCVVGVCWYKKLKKWHVQISVNKKPKSLGYFDNLFSAAIARKEAEQKYYGEFSFKG